MTTSDSNSRISPDLLIRRDDVALVYMTDDKQFNVRYKLGKAANVSLQCEAFLAKARIAETASTHFLTVGNRQLWKRMLGEAMALAIGGDLTAADEIAAEAEEFLRDRAIESARMWYVQACLALIAVLMTVYATFDLSVQTWGSAASQTKNSGFQNYDADPLDAVVPLDNPVPSENVGPLGNVEPFENVGPVNLPTVDVLTENKAESTVNAADNNLYSIGEDDVYTLKYLMLALIAGAVGAGFSVLVRIGKLSVDPAAGWKAHYGEVLFRMTIGALAGAIIIIGWQAEVFATFMKADQNALEETVMRASQLTFRSDFWKMIILAIVAGASERLVPSLLNQLSDKTAADTSAPAQNADA